MGSEARTKFDDTDIIGGLAMLRDGRQLISKFDTWTTMQMAATYKAPAGQPSVAKAHGCGVMAPEAHCFCSAGALMRALGGVLPFDAVLNDDDVSFVPGPLNRKARDCATAFRLLAQAYCEVTPPFGWLHLEAFDNRRTWELVNEMNETGDVLVDNGEEITLVLPAFVEDERRHAFVLSMWDRAIRNAEMSVPVRRHG